MTKIAFSGTSGSGKTTMVKFVENQFNLNHISGSSGDLKTEADRKHLLEKYGFAGSGGHADVIKASHANAAFGYELQEMIRVRRDELITNTDDFVTDRSPLDNFVFFLGQSALYQNNEVVNQFMDSCIETMAKLTHAIYVPALLDDIEDNGSRIPVYHYQKAVDAVFARYWQVFVHHAKVKNPSLHVYKVKQNDLAQRKAEIMDFISSNR